MAVIAETATTLSAQLEAGIGADWVPVGAPLTAVGSQVVDVPNDVPLRISLTGTVITSVQLGLAT